MKYFRDLADRRHEIDSATVHPRGRSSDAMWSWLASLIGGPVVSGLINAYKAKLEAANTQDRIAADLATKEIEAEIETRKQAACRRSQQGPARRDLASPGKSLALPPAQASR
jgi:hypothetical protein